MTTFVLGVVLLCGAETMRAQLYLQHSEHYRSLAKVRALVDRVEQLHRDTSMHAAFYCDISLQSIAMQQANTPQDQTSLGTNAEELQTALHEQITTLGSIPSFWSPAGFLPGPKAAAKRSSDMHRAARQIKSLTLADARNDYCATVAGALGRVYFVYNLRAPEGIASTLAGQVDSYRSRLKNAQGEMQSARFPTIFEQEHVVINKHLIELDAVLAGDTSDYDRFAADITHHVSSIEDALFDIRTKASDVVSIPSQVVVAAQAFQREK